MADYEATGLMEQIQALIAPPVSDNRTASQTSRSKPKHPYFKRHGRGHNHDLCDSCSEGGDLICCDKCPASFHLSCHNPPLQQEHIPVGEWLCHHCKMADAATNRHPDMFTWLLAAANCLNPTKFQLPHCMSEPCIFPGTDRVASQHRRRQPTMPTLTASSRTPLAPSSSDDSSAIAHSTCYVCSLSSRALLACDFCPLHYHLDCVDPPLTTAPTERWMCPNHVQHYVDGNLLQSSSATERNRLWARYAHQPVDQDAIKLQFFRRVHRQHPPFRRKVRLGKRKRATVPLIVQQHYATPIALLPSLRDALRLSTVIQRRQRHLLQLVDDDDEDDCVINEEQTKKEVIAVEEGSAICEPPVEPNVFMLDADGSRFLDEVLREHADRVRSAAVRQDGGGAHKRRVKMIAGGLQALDDRLLQLLALQRVHQILAEMAPVGDALFTLPKQLLSADDIERIRRIFDAPSVSRAAHYSDDDDYVSAAPSVRIAVGAHTLRARAMLCPVVSKYFYNVRNSDNAELRHDDSFMGYRPTVSTRFPEAFSMRHRNLSIGVGAGNQLQLEAYGHCNNVTPKHAVIFYDEHSKQYELLNYSTHGSYVNNVLYTNHVAERPPDGAACAGRSAELDRQVRDIVDKRRKLQQQQQRRMKAAAAAAAPSVDGDARNVGVEGAGPTTTTAPQAVRECGCAHVVSSLDAASSVCMTGVGGDGVGGFGGAMIWEGSALLQHGALLRFGCLTFVFSIVECATI